jgi:hypothetical protein
MPARPDVDRQSRKIQPNDGWIRRETTIEGACNRGHVCRRDAVRWKENPCSDDRWGCGGALFRSQERWARAGACKPSGSPGGRRATTAPAGRRGTRTRAGPGHPCRGKASAAPSPQAGGRSAGAMGGGSAGSPMWVRIRRTGEASGLGDESDDARIVRCELHCCLRASARRCLIWIDGRPRLYARSASAIVKGYPMPTAVWRARSEPLDTMTVAGRADYRGRR